VDGGAPDAGADGGAPDAGAPDAGPVAQPGPHVGDCPIFPPDNAFNRDISADPVDARSALLMAEMGSGSLYLHPDFGAAQYGLPYVVVPPTQSRVRMSFTYANESDPGPYPFPPDVPIQGGPTASGDRHAIVLEQGTCRLYETWSTYPAGGGFNAGSGALFDLTSNTLRPDGWTSATASGLPLFPGLARPEEVLDQGELRHALVFTAGPTAHSYVHPATHSSGTSSAAGAPPMGTRVRLRKDFDLSGYHGASLVILRGLQRYGMFVVDNAPAIFWSVAGAQSSRWPDADLQQIKAVPVSAFEVVALGEIHPGQ
jgi:hypothetical protein